MESQVRASRLKAIGDTVGWSFCADRDCEVVYFRGLERLLGVDVANVPFQKSDDPERLVCFCFGHSAQELTADPSIRDSIAAKCKGGEDECVTKNPQGRCCLGNVALVLKERATSGECCG